VDYFLKTTLMLPGCIIYVQRVCATLFIASPRGWN
jgi:hypothetical protein